MNKTAEVVIIGGGVNGCAAAYYLAKKGVKVVVLEATNSIVHEVHRETHVTVVRPIREPLHAMYGIKNICGLHCQRSLVILNI